MTQRLRMYLDRLIIKRHYKFKTEIFIDKWCFEEFSDMGWLFFCEYKQSCDDLIETLNEFGNMRLKAELEMQIHSKKNRRNINNGCNRNS